MANWNNPTGASAYADFITETKDRDLSVLKMLDGTTETNLPADAKKYNSSSNKFQKWDGSVWTNFGFHAPIDNHIADTSIHFPIPVGSVFMWPTTSAPTGFLLCDGSAHLRGDYPTLFSLIGTTFGAGDGSTTFNVPDFRARFPIGRDASTAACDTIGETGGSFSHTHTTPAHTHTIATHTHDLSNHVHGQPAHTHTGPSHTHENPAHFHDCQSAGATIYVTGGSHIHVVQGEGTTSAGDGRNTGNDSAKFAKARTTSVSGTGPTNGDTIASTHTHSHAEVFGTVGTGVSGDVAQTTSASGTGNTSSSGGDNTFGPNINSTGGSGTLSTTGGEGSGTTGANNPPYLTMNFIIRV